MKTRPGFANEIARIAICLLDQRCPPSRKNPLIISGQIKTVVQSRLLCLSTGVLKQEAVAIGYRIAGSKGK